MKPAFCLTLLLPVWALCQTAETRSGAASQPSGRAAAARFTDSLRGFSLAAPAGTERVRETGSRRLVAWVKRDDKEGAIRWTLEVLFTVHRPTSMPAEEYARQLAEELGKTGQFKVEAHSVGTVDGKPAMNFKGVWTVGKLSWWRVQTWVAASPTENLVLSVSGPLSDKEELESILAAAVASLKLFDPTQGLQQRQDSLKNGGALLNGLTAKGLQDLLAAEPSYFLVELDGKPAGFLKVSEGLATIDKAQGLRVVRLGALRLAGKDRRLTREELFTSANRGEETAKRVFLEDTAGQVVQEVSKQGNVVGVRTTRPGQRPTSDQRELPEAIREAYLPLAFDALVHRWLSRQKPGDYGFAVYNCDANQFDMRLLRVLGSETISHDGVQVQAVHLSDQAAIDAPVADVWVDGQGNVLRLSLPEGPALARSDRKTVAAQFAAELLELEKASGSPK